MIFVIYPDLAECASRLAQVLPFQLFGSHASATHSRPTTVTGCPSRVLLASNPSDLDLLEFFQEERSAAYFWNEAWLFNVDAYQDECINKNPVARSPS